MPSTLIPAGLLGPYDYAVDNLSGFTITVGDTLNLTESASPTVTFRLNDAIQFSESLSPLAVKALVSDRLDFSETVAPGLTSVVADSLLLSDSYVAKIKATLADGIDFSDAATVGLKESVSDAIKFSESLVRQFFETVADTLNFRESTTSGVQLALSDIVLFTESHVRTRNVNVTGSDELGLSESFSALRALIASGEDNIHLGGTLIIDGDTYNAWVMNTESLGPVKYENFNVNSIAGPYAACSDGIYLLSTSYDDDGTPIDAYLELGALDFGTKRKKIVPDVYLYATGDDRLVLRVSTTNDGRMYTDWYECHPVSESDEAVRFKVGRGLKANYFRFRIENINGGDFDLADAEARPVVLQRRI